MSDQIIDIRGVYRVPVTDALFAEAMDIKYHGVNLSPAQREDAEAHVWEELSGAVLIYAVVQDGGKGFDVGDFGQTHTDQVAYDEAFLSMDGTRVVSYDRPEGEICRVAFFLHFYDTAEPLETPFGPMKAPPPTETPEALKELMPYDPVG